MTGTSVINSSWKDIFSFSLRKISNLPKLHNPKYLCCIHIRHKVYPLPICVKETNHYLMSEFKYYEDCSKSSKPHSGFILVAHLSPLYRQKSRQKSELDFLVL